MGGWDTEDCGVYLHPLSACFSRATGRSIEVVDLLDKNGYSGVGHKSQATGS